MASGDPIITSKASVVPTGAWNLVTKLQTTGPSGTSLQGILTEPVNQTTVTHNYNNNTQQTYFPSYYSRVTVNNGSAIWENYPPFNPGTQYWGIFHDVRVNENCMDCAAVNHHWLAAGTNSNHRADTAAFSYYHVINTAGTAYSSLMEGGQTVAATAASGLNGAQSQLIGLQCGWNVWDAASPNMASGQNIFFNIINYSTTAGSTAFIADVGMSFAGKWHNLYKSIYSANPLVIDTCGIDLYSNTNWTDNIAALKIAGNTIIDLNGASVGNYIRYESTDGGRIAIASQNGYAATFTPAQVYIVGNCTAQSFTDRSKVFTGTGALTQLAAIKPKETSIVGDWGEVDHSTLPKGVRRTLESGEEGRDIGGLLDMAIKAIMELNSKVEALEKAIH